MVYRYNVSLLCGLGLIALVGCSHSNPLNQYSHEQVARDLMASAVAAELKLGLTKHTGEAGYLYPKCMNGEGKKKICSTLYRAMVSNLQRKYRGLSVSDVQDQNLWSYVKDYYQENAFNRLPG